MGKNEIKEMVICIVMALVLLVAALVVAHSIIYDGANQVKLLLLKLNTAESLMFAIGAVIPIITSLWRSRHPGESQGGSSQDR